MFEKLTWDHVKLNVDFHIQECRHELAYYGMHGGQRTNVAVGPYFLSYWRQVLLLWSSVYAWLAGWLISKILLPIAYVPVEMLGLQKLSVMHLVWAWGLKILTRALTVAEQALLPSEPAHHPKPTFKHQVSQKYIPNFIYCTLGQQIPSSIH